MTLFILTLPDTNCIYRIMSFLKSETNIIILEAIQKGRTVIIFVENFKIDVIVFIGNITPTNSFHIRISLLILTLSLCEIKGRNVQITDKYTIYVYCW
jgi:hypothetical protein